MCSRRHPGRGALRGTRAATALVAAMLSAVWLGAADRIFASDSVEAVSPAGETASADWRVVVHPANPVRSLAREDLERIYRGRNRFWADGSKILPLNLPGEDPLRAAFSRDVLHDSEENLATYWNREYFQGLAPPVVLQSSRAVVAFVAATPNAIGYVRPSDVDASVAVVEVLHVR